MTTPQFVLDLRAKIGHAPLWMPGVKGVVLRAGADGTEVLLVQRRDNGRWTVPAGILEPGEEPAAGIQREVLEETGVRARASRLVGVQTTAPTQYPNGDQAQYLDVVMALEPLGGQARVNDDENLAVAWRPVTQLEDVPPLHRRAIEWALSLDPALGAGPLTGPSPADVSMPDAAGSARGEGAWFVGADGEPRRGDAASEAS